MRWGVDLWTLLANAMRMGDLSSPVRTELYFFINVLTIDLRSSVRSSVSSLPSLFMSNLLARKKSLLLT